MTETEKRELEALRAENAKLKATAQGGLSLKISPKGGVMLLGLRAFPVTFYAQEWTKITAMSDKIAKFLVENEVAIAEREKNPEAPKADWSARRGLGKTG